MQRDLVFALHGFLGQGSDWDQVKKACADSQASKAHDLEWLTPSLFSSESEVLLPFDQFCEALVEKHKVQLNSSRKRIFIGYSLGGRLGLHLLKKFSEQFDHFIFVSTHPGLTNEVEKEERRSSDAQWFLKITASNWNHFLKEWNSQGVFKSDSTDPIRSLDDYNLQKLQISLAAWSLAEQKDLRELIKQHQQKITWVVGQQDLKFLNLANDLLQKKILLNVSRIFSGHRILFENPKELASVLLHQLR